MKHFTATLCSLLILLFSVPTSAGAERHNWRTPTTNFKLKKPFAPGEHNWNAGHRGVDLQGTAGQNVISPEDGEVHFIGNIAGKNTLSIKHSDALRSTFEPVVSQLKTGDKVKKGQVIGTLQPDHAGCPSCLHWGVKTGDKYLNPLLFLNLQHAILLPR